MPKKQKSFSRKEIREDKLVTYYYKALQLLEDYKRELRIGAGVVVVLILGYLFFLNRANVQNEEANLELSRMTPIYQQGAFLEAIEGQPGTSRIGLEQIVEKYDGTENGETAKVMLANSYYFLEEIDKAQSYYEDYGGDVPLLEAASYAGVAACHESRANYAEAAEWYEKAASAFEENVLAPKYLVMAGVNYLDAGDKESAREALERVKTDYAQSAYARDVERHMARATY